VAVADFNNDGLEDIFFTGNETSCRLYLNKGRLKFEDVTEQAGLETTRWCTGVAIADVNGDGLRDIYVCVAGYPQPERRGNLLFVNQGPAPGGGVPAFREMAAEYGIADTGYSTQAAFFDYDNDGDLDLYVMNHANERATLNTPLPKKTNGEGSSNDHLYRNNGGGTFTDVTKEAGILTEGYGLGIAISDFNRDGRPDIYISNDFIYNDLLYINEQGTHFTNRISSYLHHQTYNGMGCDVADFNNDALPDIVEMDMLPETDAGQKMMAGVMTWDKSLLIEQAGYAPQYMRNTLQLATPAPNHPSSTVFSEIAQLAGVAATDWSWAPLFADFDNDGWKDLFITNGYLRDITDKDFIDYTSNITMFKSPGEADRELLPKVRQLKGKILPNRMFRNNRDLTFLPETERWGIAQPSCSNGAAYADLDNDGDLDLVINNINEPAFLYENRADRLRKNNYLNIRLEGLPGNPEGIGVAVTVQAGGQRQYMEQYGSRGFMSTVTSVLHFGLGEISTIDTLEIRWNDGKKQVLTKLPAARTLVLKQADARPYVERESPAPTAIFTEKTGQDGLVFTHQESIFNDFRFQPLLPHGFSKNGPPLAVGDLDGDGREDFYAGGAKGQPGRLFFQQPNGKFTHKDLSEGSESEDTGALIFDADGDGFPDLFVASGSSEFGPESPLYQSRLYRNDGKGNLHWAKKALPEMRAPASCAAAADFDGDGDTDLFIGGSALPGSYPQPARSYLLRNDDGIFTDVTDMVSSKGENSSFIIHHSSLEYPGIVTAAQWADLDGDGAPELVLAGEWMPITVFKNNKGQFADATAAMGLDKTAGWWNTLAIHDLDGDGDLDIAAGNLGLNTKWKVSEQQPLTVYTSDFDNNGKFEGIICRYTGGKEKPVHQRDELLAAINGLGKKYPRYATYASASVQEIFGEKALSGAKRLVCHFMQTAIFINESGKRFTAKPLPVQAQFAPVNAILCADFNWDGHIDLLLAGNTYSSNVSTGQHDASHGLLLTGNGKGGFLPENAIQSGFFVEGAVAALAQVALKSGGSLLLAGVNAASLRAFVRPQKALRGLPGGATTSVSSLPGNPALLNINQIVIH
jgi:hypothetical protein